MKRLKIAIVGFGRLGRACGENAGEGHDLEVVGVVARPGATPLPAPLGRLAVAGHLRDLPQQPQAALLCVPPSDATGVGCELLQQRMPVVECVALEGRARRAHYDAIGEAAHRHRVAAVVGAGWCQACAMRWRPSNATQVFEVDSVAALEHAARGIVDLQPGLHLYSLRPRSGGPLPPTSTNRERKP